MTELESDKQTTRDLELDDLLISNTETEEPKGGNNKKLILLSAIGVLLFAIVVLVVYLLQGDSKEENTQNPTTQKPLDTLEPQKPQTSGNPQDTEFGQVPIQKNTGSDDQFQAIIDQIKAQQGQNNNPPSQALPAAPSSTPKAESPKPVQKPAQPKPETPKQEPKTSPKDSFKDVQTSDPSLQGSEAMRGFYIQVGSFSKFSPNKQLLGLINENKLSYRMQKSGDNNRLLIGPYTTKQEAQDKLNDIRAKINKDAFIKEIK